jgi:hypothetical protein
MSENCRVYIDGVKDAERVAAKTFSVTVPGEPCQHWASGEHIVVGEDDYHCKCGKHFLLLEVTP